MLIKQLVELFNDVRATDFEFEGAGFSLKLKRGVLAHSDSATNSNEARTLGIARVSGDAEHPLPQPSIASKQTHTIRSGITGTFFRASSPDKSPFVSLGERVLIGQTICLIEAMKMLNEMDADCEGTLVEVLLDDGAAVSAGTPLFVIEVDDVR
ncbi:biotin/lipoyl-containing protein [Paraburkholderia sp. BL21I4N1]|uniref:biotin/lipoyl-containing protein n=1 Tax=Paraburkholderia sp. BL21I4N1 TaxID=1938801 RepID=UPI0011B200C3|nr:biotin/lipoyl-containing protein [Paraburkholderia sp. BL21I4N1]